MKAAVVGLGYVGLPLAHLFPIKYKTIGFDVDQSRVDSLMSGYDSTMEVSNELLQSTIEENGSFCTTELDDIKDCNFYVMTVPTPININSRPDLTPLIGTSTTVEEASSRGDIVVYESTVYLGVTEEEHLPAVEKASGLEYNIDFFAGCSPEYINPGDKEHTVEEIKRVTSGSTPETVDVVDTVYNSVLVNGTYKAPTIEVAEALEIIENSQCDVNIASMNELAKIFNAMGIDTNDAIKAVSSRWNFIKLRPGLAGSHCISVDSYYLIRKAQVYNVLPRIMSATRRLSDGMGGYAANQVIRLMNRKRVFVRNSKILILGITFKENCPDIRNTKTVDIYSTLNEYSSNIVVYNPWVDSEKVFREYGIRMINNDISDLQGKFDAVVSGVAHGRFKNIGARRFLSHEYRAVYDVKGVLGTEAINGRL